MPAFINEPARDIPVQAEYDVIIAGGGIAGVTAAIAAARNDVSVFIIERYCGLGGLATLGNVTIWLPLCDGRGNQVIGGLGEDLLHLSVADLKQDNKSARFIGIPDCWKKDGDPAARSEKRYRTDFNPAAYMLALEDLVIKHGINIMYDTRFCAIRKQENSISHIIIENKDGRSAIAGKIVIDTTGDADVCHAAGEHTESLDSNVLTGWFYTLIDGELRLHQNSNSYCPEATREGGQGPFFRGDQADQVTAQILGSRGKIRTKLAAMAEKNPEKDIQLIMPFMMACFRMTRRLAGTATLSAAQVHTWCEEPIGLTGDWRKAGPVYAIPYKTLTAVHNTNLLTAGRSISADNSVWDVMRAIPTCTVTGQAAGTAAALSIHNKCSVQELPYPVLRDTLIDQRVILDKGLVVKQ